MSPDAYQSQSHLASAYNGAPSFSAFGIMPGQGRSQNGAAPETSYNQMPTSTHNQGQGPVDTRTDTTKPFNARPGRITLPPQGFPGPMHPNQFSPTVPMTPGMPGFTFHAIPQTPPAYHHFLSPGLNGPLSPLLGSPQMGPATPGAGSGAFNPHLNHAPGAPIHFTNGMTTPISNVLAGLPSGYNPMFPPMGMNYPVSSVPHQPQQQYGLPQTPHWSQPRPPQSRQKKQEPPIDDPVEAQEESTAAATSQEGRFEQEHTPGSQNTTSASKEDEEGYPFPVVSPFTAALSQRRASTNSPAITPRTGPNLSAMPKSPGWERRGSLALNMSSLSTDDPSSSSRLGLRRLLASNNGTSKTDNIKTDNLTQASLGDALELKADHTSRTDDDAEEKSP